MLYADDKFNIIKHDALDMEFRKQIEGLVSAADFKRATLQLEENKFGSLTTSTRDKTNKEAIRLSEEEKKNKANLKRKKLQATLSFGLDEEQEQEEVSLADAAAAAIRGGSGDSVKKVSKNPG